MPELPEVETSRRGIAPHIEGRKVERVTVRDARLRWPVPSNLPALIEGQELLEVARRGKYLLLRFASGSVLMHLGMSGNVRIVSSKVKLLKHDHVDIAFAGGKILRLNDPRRFGAVLWTSEPVEVHPLISHLGPEPLSEDFTAELLYQRSRKRTQAVKTFIMDSRIVVGVGNIYANEALFKAGIRPTKPAGKVSRAAYAVLFDEIRQVLSKAIKQGGTTLRDFVGGDGKPGYFKQELTVYGRGGEPCVVCEKPLKEVRLGQRSTVYCTDCQK